MVKVNYYLITLFIKSHKHLNICRFPCVIYSEMNMFKRFPTANVWSTTSVHAHAHIGCRLLRAYLMSRLTSDGMMEMRL